MRIAVMIISLCLSILVGLQSCTLIVGGEITKNHDASSIGGIGIILGILFFLGGAFAIGLPKISQRIFFAAGCLALFINFTSRYDYMLICALVAAILAAMASAGVRELTKKQKIDEKATSI